MRAKARENVSMISSGPMHVERPKSVLRFHILFFFRSIRFFFPEKNKRFLRKSVLTLADCEWRGAAPWLKPLRLPRAQPSMS